jgi:hypothetical protein
MLSGIGAKEELYEVGIQPRVDLHGVGKNQEDHLVRNQVARRGFWYHLTFILQTVFVFYEVPQGFTTDHLAHGEGVYEKSQEEWRTKRTGTLSRSQFGMFRIQ